MTGVEPAFLAWEASVIPLYDIRSRSSRRLRLYMTDHKKAILVSSILVITALVSPAVAQEDDGTLVETRTTEITADRVAKGQTITLGQDELRLGVFPKVLTRPTAVTIKRRLAAAAPAVPDGLLALSDYWEIDVADDTAVSGKKPFVLQLQVNNPQGLLRVLAWQGKQWRELPTTLVDRTTVRVFFTVPFIRLIVVGNQALVSGAASWYRYKKCDCAASPDYPKGSVVRVTNISNGKTVDVTINDFGPDRAIHPDRAIDLDYVAFAKIANPRAGIITVTVEPVSGRPLSNLSL